MSYYKMFRVINKTRHNQRRIMAKIILSFSKTILFIYFVKKINNFQRNKAEEVSIILKVSTTLIKNIFYRNIFSRCSEIE